MAKAYMCDLCKKFYTEDSSKPEYYIGNQTDLIFMYLDLCPDCSKKLSALVAGDAKIVMQNEENINKEVSDDSNRLIEIFNPRNEKFTDCGECIHDGDTPERCKQRGCTHAFTYLLECFNPKSDDSRAPFDEVEDKLEIGRRYL